MKRAASINGTCLQGYIDRSYAELVAVLGEPNYENDGYKVDAQWAMETDEGVVFTIYNYKDGQNYLGAAGVPTTAIRDWHIGGTSQKAVDAVRDCFPTAHLWRCGSSRLDSQEPKRGPR